MQGVGIALGAASGFSDVAGRGLALPDPHRPVEHLLHDLRYGSPRRFARECNELGLRSIGVNGDITALWYDVLQPLWKAHPAAVAGATGFSSLFCLERLAWDVDMRVALRIEHRREAGGDTRHRVSGADALVARFAGGRIASQWRQLFVRTIASLPSDLGRPASRAIEFTTPASSPHPADPPYLVSWILAPRTHVASAARQSA